MSAFIQGLKFGAITGLLNKTFSDYCCSFNPISNWRFTPSFFMPNFFMPTLYSGWFNSYHNLDYDFPSCWNFTPPSLTFPQQNFAWQNLTPQPLESFSAINYWNNFSGFDSFEIAGTQEKTPTKIDTGVETPETIETNDKNISDSYNATQLKEKWNKSYPKTEHLPIEFYKKIISISKELDCDPNDLMAVINLETAGSFKASAQNKNTKATGLIQFMPDTAKAYGTNIDKLAKMTEVEQLDYVRKYLLDKKKNSRIKGHIDATTLYCFIFWPAAANKKDTYIIARNNPNKEKDAYDLNNCLDVDKDNVITRADLRKSVQKYMA